MKLKDITNGPDWMIWVVFAVFVLITILLLTGHCKAKMKRKDPKISEKLYATRKSSRLRDFESTRPAH